MTSSGKAVLTLPTDTQIKIVREFGAPKHLVFKVWTTPELIRRWWHGGRGEVTVAEVDLRVGGRWRYVSVTSRGFEVGFHGEYREIVPNERIVWTEVYEGMPGGNEPQQQSDDGAAVNTITFTEKDGRTTVSILTQVPSREVRDAILKTGMEAGMQDAMDLLEEVAASIR